MKKYRVTVNGTAYEIQLEELTGAAPAPAAAPAAAPAPAAAAPAGGEQVTSPMPGTILDAMKMENEIMCPRSGTVASINTSKGASVESGTLLCVIQ